MTAVKWTKTWCFQQSVSFFRADLMFAFTVVGPAALQYEFCHHLIWNSSHRALTSHQIMSWQTQQPQYTRSWIKTNGVEMLPKKIPGHQWHLGAAEVGKTRTKATPNSSAGPARGSGCWQKTSPRSTWMPEAMFGLVLHFIYNWKKNTRSKNSCETLPGSLSHQQPQCSQGSCDQLSELTSKHQQLCSATGTPFRWVTLRFGILSKLHHHISPLHAYLRCC